MSLEPRNLLAFGMGVGIEIGEGGLDVTIARVRPGGVDVPGHLWIPGFPERPAAECGAGYAAFLRAHGASHLTAAVVLPRRETIVRLLTLPGVASKDLASAIRFQADSLHPYEEDDAAYGWVPVGPAGSGTVLIGIARAAVLERHTGWFAEAGIAISSITFSASVFHGALRLYGEPARELVALGAARSNGRFEIYGESAAKPVFSAEFDGDEQRALRLAAAELRLVDAEPSRIERVLPVPRANPVENDLASSAVSYAAALACACPRLARAANLLPRERRASHSRAMLIPTAAMLMLAVLLAAAWFGAAAYQERRYLRTLQAEIAKVEPLARKAAALERETETARARILAVDGFRVQLKKDLDAFQELTRILPPPVWTTSVEITKDAVLVNGESDRAGPLLELIDGSPEFRNSEFVSLTRVANSEVFRIRAVRRGARK